MHKYLFALLLFPCFAAAQNVLEVSSFRPSTETELSLLKSSKEIKNNTILNHQLVDLVKAYTVDSIFTRKTERHQVFGGGVIRVLGYRWKAIDQSRQKFVGWVNRHYLHGSNDEAHFTEYDINYDLIPTLPDYKKMAYEAYQEQFRMKKSKKKSEEGQAPFIYPTEDTDMTKYRFHCENTPPIDFRSLLNSEFFPVHRNNDLSVHPNFKEANPVMGMYGVLALDCNHGCHPEIHPYEWVWWMNLTEKKTSWNIGFLRDVSSRFKHWSSSPRTGEIAIPFAFPIASENWEVYIDHQMFGNFSSEGFAELDLPEASYDFSETLRTFQFEESMLNGKTINVLSSMKVPYQSFVYYFSELNVDEESGVVSGYFNLATSIAEIYTCEVRFNYEQNRSNELTELLSLMEGSFTSAKQADADSDYYDISLHMYPIWEDSGVSWFYVEQSLTAMPDRPYRQRIYKVEQLDNLTFRSGIYLMPNDSMVIGQWKNPKFFDQWDEKQLIEKEGCDVILKKTAEGIYEGSTLGSNCISGFRGALYATSKVKISKEGLDSWDQGWDEKHQQVWGAEKGAYLFRK